MVSRQNKELFKLINGISMVKDQYHDNHAEEVGRVVEEVENTRKMFGI